MSDFLYFINFSPREIIDLLIVSIFIYLILLFVKQTKTFFILNMAIGLFAINFLSQFFDLVLTRRIFQGITALLVIVMVIVFQRELRRFLRWMVVNRSFSFARAGVLSHDYADEIVSALNIMSDKKIGGIIVFKGEQPLDDLLDGGEILDGRISKELILSIFDTSSPGHDGAIVIQGNRIRLFGAHLPLARDYAHYKNTGTRHRAAAGITESTDSFAIVVSEERGVISLAKGGKLKEFKDENEVRDELNSFIKESVEDTNPNFWKHFFVKNWGIKVASITIALVLWGTLVNDTGLTKKEFSVPLVYQKLPENLVIDSTASKSTVGLILAGDSQDFADIDPTKLEARVNASEFKAGANLVTVATSSFNIPQYIDVISFTPRDIYIYAGESKK